MTGAIVVVGTVVRCAHGGHAQPTPDPRVTILGQPVITTAGPWLVVECPSSPPPGPCVTATWLTAASRVRVGGQPVVVDHGQGVCVPTGAPLVVGAGQGRVSAA
ncbi:MAG TPA: hypothetical protein VF244_10665, partial [Acidimicrobiales bacterium]